LEKLIYTKKMPMIKVVLVNLNKFQQQQQSRTQSNACARARMALALGKLTTGTPKFRGCGFVGMHVKPITAQEKFNFPRANAILARAQALLWVRNCNSSGHGTQINLYFK
jgi:hypothetical protein